MYYNDYCDTQQARHSEKMHSAACATLCDIPTLTCLEEGQIRGGVSRAYTSLLPILDNQPFAHLSDNYFLAFTPAEAADHFYGKRDVYGSTSRF